MQDMETPKIPSSFAENISYFDRGLEQAFSWFSGNFGTFLFILFIGLITILVARNVNRLMESYFKKASSKLRMDITAFRMFRHITVATIYFIGIIVVIFSIPSLQQPLCCPLYRGRNCRYRYRFCSPEHSEQYNCRSFSCHFSTFQGWRSAEYYERIRESYRP